MVLEKKKPSQVVGTLILTFLVVVSIHCVELVLAQMDVKVSCIYCGNYQGLFLVSIQIKKAMGETQL